MIKTLDILVGLPGMGKTSLAKTLNGKIVEVDKYRIKNGIYNFNIDNEDDVFTQSLFDSKPDESTFNRVIYDECFWTTTHKKRRNLINALKFLYDFKTINIHIFPFNPEISLNRRNKNSKGTDQLYWSRAIKELVAEYEEVNIEKYLDCNCIHIGS